MKRLFFFVTIFVFIACNDQAKKNAKTADSTGSDTNTQSKIDIKKNDPPIDPTLWKIDNTLALKMKKYLKGCKSGCVDTSEVLNFNYPVRDAIQRMYPNSKIVAVNARYTADYDDARYCILRQLTDPKACKVKNHNTVIYMVAKDSSNNLTEDEYFDIVTICPPPRECDRTDSLK